MSYFAVFDLKGGQTQIINQCKNGNITSKNITSHTFIHTCVIKHQLQRYLGVGGGESPNMTDDLPVDIYYNILADTNIICRKISTFPMKQLALALPKEPVSEVLTQNHPPLPFLIHIMYYLQ